MNSLLLLFLASLATFALLAFLGLIAAHLVHEVLKSGLAFNFLRNVDFKDVIGPLQHLSQFDDR